MLTKNSSLIHFTTLRLNYSVHRPSSVTTYFLFKIQWSKTMSTMFMTYQSVTCCYDEISQQTEQSSKQHCVHRWLYTRMYTRMYSPQLPVTRLVPLRQIIVTAHMVTRDLCYYWPLTRTCLLISWHSRPEILIVTECAAWNNFHFKPCFYPTWHAAWLRPLTTS